MFAKFSSFPSVSDKMVVDKGLNCSDKDVDLTLVSGFEGFEELEEVTVNVFFL